jgi:hypothetical protein
MPRFYIAPVAQQDIQAVLSWKQAEWGEQARLRYEALLVRAIIDVATTPESPFDALFAPGPVPADGRAGLRVLRRSGV